MPHVERAFAGLAHQSEGFGKQTGERLSTFRPITQSKATLAQFGIALRSDFFAKNLDLGQNLCIPGQPSATGPPTTAEIFESNPLATVDIEKQLHAAGIVQCSDARAPADPLIQ